MAERQFPEIRTKRLILGEIDSYQLAEIAEQANNIKIAENTLNLPFPYRERDAQNWVEMQQEMFNETRGYVFAIYLRDSKVFVGGCGLHLDVSHNKAEIGYWIGEEFWQNGIATEAARALLDFGFNRLVLNKVYATCFKGNKASARVLKKLKFEKEGFLKQHFLKNGRYKDVYIFGLIKDNFR